jgi:hypothetical protein
VVVVICTICIGAHFKDRQSKEPDGGFIPEDVTCPPATPCDSDGNPFPNIVVEIAYGNESFLTLKSELELWLSEQTSVQMGIGVKIGGPTTKGLRRMRVRIFILYTYMIVYK